MFSSSRVKACASRTPAMFSCRSAFTPPISRRAWRNALRAWSENQTVASAMTGTVAMLIRAKGTLRLSMVYVSHTISSTPRTTCTSAKLTIC